MVSKRTNKILRGLIAVYIQLGLMLFVSVSAMDMPEQVCSSGAVKTNSVSLYVKGTIGQPAIQNCNSVSLYIKSGFFQTYSVINGKLCHPGDLNNDNNFSILDVIYLINYKYKDGPAPVPDEICSADTDCNCEINIIDAVLLISYMYKSGLPPCNYTYWRTSCE